MATLTTAQLNTMTPQARAAYYVSNLQAAAKKGTLSVPQQAELTKYKAVAATASGPVAGTVIAGSAPAAAIASAQNPTAASTFVAPSAWGQPISLASPSSDTYTLAQQWAYAIANPAAAKAAGNLFSQAANPIQQQAGALSNVKTYGQFQLNNLETQIIGQGAAYFPTQFYGAIPQSALDAGKVTAAGINSYQSAFVGAGGTVVTRPEQQAYGSTIAPAGGNAASLVPTPAATSNVTPQGSGTPNSTGVLDTGTGAITSVPAPTTGAGSFSGGGLDTGTATGTTTGSGITTADMILIGIGAVGLLLAMKGKKHHVPAS